MNLEEVSFKATPWLTLPGKKNKSALNLSYRLYNYSFVRFSRNPISVCAYNTSLPSKLGKREKKKKVEAVKRAGETGDECRWLTQIAAESTVHMEMRTWSSHQEYCKSQPHPHLLLLLLLFVSVVITWRAASGLHVSSHSRKSEATAFTQNTWQLLYLARRDNSGARLKAQENKSFTNITCELLTRCVTFFPTLTANGSAHPIHWML